MTDAEASRPLRDLRQKAGKSQQEVASELGISLKTYQRWEKDAASLEISKAVALARYFQVTLKALL